MPGPSQRRKLVCRVCNDTILEKNYSAHLAHAHPEENAKDLSDKNARKITWNG